MWRWMSLLWLGCLLVGVPSAQAQTSAMPCVAIMGDSLPAGAFVAQIPGTGVTVLESKPIVDVLDTAFAGRDWYHIGIYDLSVAASALTHPEIIVYPTTAQFNLGASLNCQAVLIFPFMNDLYISDDTLMGVADYGSALNTMLGTIRADSPNSDIILLSFFHTTLGGLGGATYGDDVTVAHVRAMNTHHDIACSADVQITCVSLLELFQPVENYVVGAITPEAYAERRYSPQNPADQTMLDAYWASNPAGSLLGDNLHLSPEGKTTIVATLMREFTVLEPVNFAPLSFGE